MRIDIDTHVPTVSNLYAGVENACWYEERRDARRAYVDHQAWFSTEALKRETEAYEAVGTLLKGPEMELPNGLTFRDLQDIERRDARVKGWDRKATTYRSAASVSSNVADQLRDIELPCWGSAYQDRKPLSFGHVWLDGEPHVDRAPAACLDYSIAKNWSVGGLSLVARSAAHMQES